MAFTMPQSRTRRSAPTVRVPEHEPVILTPKAQEAILKTFTEPNEWLSHVLAGRCGLRSGEVRALAPSDYRGRDEDGIAWLSVTKAMQTLSWDGEPGPTKNKRNRTVPIPDDLADTIESLWPASARLAADENAPMLANPRTNRRWSHWGLRASWLRGCTSAGAPQLPLYEGTKHSVATDMLARTKDRAAVRDYLGHTDARSTDKYAKVTSGALVDIAKRKKPYTSK
jgi:integrase